MHSEDPALEIAILSRPGHARDQGNQMALLINAHPDGRARGVAEDLMKETARVDRELDIANASGEVLGLEQSRRQMRALATLAASHYERPKMPTGDRRFETPFGDVLVRTYAPASTGAMIVLVHGGGWVAGGIDTHDSIARWLADEAKASVAVIEYSLAPEHPFPRGIIEVASVVRAIAAELDRSRRLVLIGDSAGANIAAMTLLHLSAQERRRVDGFVSLYGPYAPAMDLSSHRLYGDGSFGLSAAEMQSCWMRYASAMLPDRAAEITPIGQDLSGFPPTLCIGAEYDVLLDDTLALYSELAAAQVDVSLSLWSGLTHGCLHYVGAVDSVTRAARSMLPFINSATRPHPQTEDSTPAQRPAKLAAFSALEHPAVQQPRPARRRHSSVAHRLGVQILRGEIKSGDLLPTEEDASAALGVSRSAYREAMRTLSAKGLITSLPKVGTKIAPREKWNILDPDLLSWSFEAEPDEKFIRDLFELRNTVEPTAASMAALRRNDDDLGHLSAALAKLAGSNPGSPDSFTAEAEFHRRLLFASKNEALCGLWSAIELTLRWAAKLQRMLPIHQTLESLVTDHSRLLDRIVARQADEAHAAMSELISHSFADAIANLRQVRRVTGGKQIA
jgi:DNA-binding FadR family transcriptional regulator/acetyl esterase/lipase